MFNKTIFKQTFKSNYKLWLIFTIILCALSSAIIAVYDPKAMASMANMLKESSLGSLAGDRLDGMASLLGMLGNNFYAMLATILPLIYIIITANNLVALQVDRGSMAYTLSTPIKRSTVVFTQAIYLISSLAAMVTVLAVSGIVSVQLCHGGIIGKAYTKDVKAISEELNLDEEKLDDNLNLILDNKDAIKEGAKARDIDTDVYTAYLKLKLSNESYETAADILGVSADEVSENLNLILENDKALKACAKVMNQDTNEYRAYLQATIAQQENLQQSQEIQENLINGLTAAADELDMELEDLSADMGVLKNNKNAMNIAVKESKIPEEMIVSIINQKLASDELALDDGVNFNIKEYIILNVGLFFLLFATSSISFAASCIFNLSKNSLSFGAGIPLAFFVFNVMSQTDESLANLKYLTINTLFNSGEIVNGGSYGIQFIALAIIGVTLYLIGIDRFNKKDLPL